MAGKIKTLPKVLAGLAIVGALGYFGNKALDKVPNTPTVQPQVAVEQPAAVVQPAAPAAVVASPAPQAPVAPAKQGGDALDALIHEAGKK
jgi:hypothetical protein